MHARARSAVHRLLLVFLVLDAAHGLAIRRTWDVTLVRGDDRRTLPIAEHQSILSVAEAAGMLPGSDCRRGNCLSCAARVVNGAPYALRVSSDTALCEEAHCEGLVLLCSAYPCGPGLELHLDAEGDAWEIQHFCRFQRGCKTPPPREDRPPAAHFHDPEDLVVLLERCRQQEAAEAAGDAAADASGDRGTA